MSLSRKWWPMWAIAAAIVVMVSTQFWLDWVFAGLPVEVPVDLSTASTVATKVHLRSPERYAVSLRVYSNDRSFKEVAGILGEPGQYPLARGGVPVRARISLTELGHRRVVFDKDVVSHNQTGTEWGTMVWRTLAWVHLTPGDYELRVQIPEPVPGLSGFRTAIALEVYSVDNRAFGMAMLVWVLSVAVISISVVAILLRALTSAAERVLESAKPSSRQPRWHVLWAGLIVLGIGIWGQLRDPLFHAPDNLESNVPITIVMSCLAFYLIWIALKRPRAGHDTRGSTAENSDAGQ